MNYDDELIEILDKRYSDERKYGVVISSDAVRVCLYVAILATLAICQSINRVARELHDIEELYVDPR